MSATLRVRRRVRDLRSRGRRVYDAGLGESPIPVPAFVQQALAAQAYRGNYGSAEACDKLRDVLGCGRVLVGGGLKPLIFTLLASLQHARPDLRLVLLVPTWNTYADQARQLGIPTTLVHPSGSELGGGSWRVDPQKLRAAVQSLRPRTTLVIWNNPNNPSGIVYGRDAVAAVGAVLREARCMVLEDAIYRDLSHATPDTVSIANYYPEGTMVGYSLSKTFGAGGYRFGYIAFPAALGPAYRSCLSLASTLYSCPSSPAHHAAVNILGPVCAERRARLNAFQRRMYADALRVVRAGLEGSGVDVSDSGGAAWYVLLDFHRVPGAPSSSPTIARRLMDEAGVAVVSGSSFGVPPHRPIVRCAFVGIRRVDLEAETYDLSDISNLSRSIADWAGTLEAPHPPAQIPSGTCPPPPPS